MGLQSFRYTCFILCSSPWATVPAWSQLLCELSTGCSFPHSTRACCSTGFSTGCSGDVCSVFGCSGAASFPTVFSIGFRVESAPTPGAPPPHHSSLTLMCSLLLLSSIFLLSKLCLGVELFLNNNCLKFFPPVSILVGLSRGLL